MRRPPHAPFRAGAPRFVPAMRQIGPEAWLVPDSEAHVLEWKAGLLADTGRTCRQAPDAGPAADEAARIVAASLGRPRGDLREVSRYLSDDLVVMERRGGGWTCTALTLTAPTFFSIETAFGRDVAALHGPVPGGAGLSARIARIFDHLGDAQVLERFNWTLQPGVQRHTPDAAPLRALADTISPEDALEALYLRVERQTVRRLPRTGAILFTIRVCLDPLAALAREDRPPLAAAWRSIGPQGRAYKGWDALERLTDAAFARWGV